MSQHHIETAFLQPAPIDPYIQNFVSRACLCGILAIDIFMDTRPITHSTTSGSPFHSITCLGVLSADFNGLRTLWPSMAAAHAVTSVGAFQGVTLSFHSSDYQFYKAKISLPVDALRPAFSARNVSYCRGATARFCSLEHPFPAA